MFTRVRDPAECQPGKMPDCYRLKSDLDTPRKKRLFEALKLMSAFQEFSGDDILSCPDLHDVKPF